MRDRRERSQSYLSGEGTQYSQIVTPDPSTIVQGRQKRDPFAIPPRLFLVAVSNRNSMFAGNEGGTYLLSGGRSLRLDLLDGLVLGVGHFDRRLWVGYRVSDLVVVGLV